LRASADEHAGRQEIVADLDSTFLLEFGPSRSGLLDLAFDRGGSGLTDRTCLDSQVWTIAAFAFKKEGASPHKILGEQHDQAGS